MKHQLIRSWSFNPVKENMQEWPQSNYFPQYTGHTYAPASDLTSNKYVGLDMFVTSPGKGKRPEYVTLNFQRKAKVYLFATAQLKGTPTASLAGWKSEGMVQFRDLSERGKEAVIGLGAYKPGVFVPARAYAFSKIGENVVIPDSKYLTDNVQGIRATGGFVVLVAEQDGSPVKAPKGPAGMTIPAGGRCPTALHDLWTAKGTDAADPQTRNMKFETYHPMWDPCFWCAYDHEHGSAAKELMGYTPRYGYTALKNEMQDESKKGFKDLVLDLPKHRVYYGIHGHMSQPGRFTVRFHTLVIAVTNKATKELLLELRFKADFGHRTTRLNPEGSGLMPLTKADEDMANEDPRGPRRHRLLNVINPGNLDPRFLYRDAPDQIQGRYEVWSTAPMCSDTTRGNEPLVDFQTMGLALKTASGTGTTVLGFEKEGKFYQQAGTRRRFKSSFKLGDEFCGFDLAGETDNGKFYTDVYGRELLSGPGPGAVAQFIKPGFEIQVSGKFEPMDTWLNLYLDGVTGNSRNIGYAIEETQN